MNLLVRLLNDSELIDELADAQLRSGHDVAKFGDLLDAALERQASFPLIALSMLTSLSDADAIGELLSDSEVHESDLRESYLPIVDTTEWDSWIAQASRWPPAFGSEWATFVSGARGGLGLIVPNDDLDVPRVSLFRHDLHAVGRISLEAPSDGPLTATMTRGGRHCGIPDRGVCAPGCGSCVLRLREAEPRGLICVCDHDQ